MATTAEGRASATELALRYTAGVTIAHLLAVTEVVLVMTALRRETLNENQPPFTDASTGLIIALAVVAVIVVAVGSLANVLPSLRWYVDEATPTPRQRRSALRVVRRTTILLVATWAGSGAVVVLTNLGDALSVTVLVGPAVFFGATAAVCTALLLTMRPLHPLSAAADPYGVHRDSADNAPGVIARLLMMWVLCCALPSVGVALLILIRSHGWIIDQASSVEIPVLVLCAVAVLWGLRGMVLVSRSISDPVREVVEAMADVERGDIRRRVDVYERSEIGLLQSGFNRMVAGLRERDRLRDLFGRHVGDDVVRLLVERNESLYRDVCEVSVLFVDLSGFTQFAADRPPQEVADVINDFYGTVVAVVEQRGGFINKFQGDAALVVFGAPVPTEDAAGDAAATARDLSSRLAEQPQLDFGIGVTAGQVFAGFVGAENRFEYTVIGDPVNEAARLADRAKASPARVLCSGAVLQSCDESERRRWAHVGAEVLRGRSTPTQLHQPLVAAGDYELSPGAT
ncbi:adenylate/guanylate cyclase domain-containing protein [[Mycobacterium] burgundiense]|uniref:Adenylate/guanylate cyclase domain-containing protein n=1 Tax=[Mycobacterium] burgundiense TaxID=3064286 RepID=A0ABN9N2I6_9MYCO|nr:adenylate/guanylate cyclase domain-containing protein [Mycolicibacterium sp. MU0053]CAJ1499426.1 adenylate/guanylate cyclase domain-containing protein [Mycolicibacterium sp. MU0053]